MLCAGQGETASQACSGLEGQTLGRATREDEGATSSRGCLNGTAAELSPARPGAAAPAHLAGHHRAS
jgi:hypothetical protein